ncbi:ketosamine-3-kinase-like [Penaeus chinensis]|uniref:ketosamine-3-kinase-like n=1 Tax=Penaeus chinensis TaxID=139456 RepID=UPI001FB5A670|nr:ketosamine-3-kinase-like [Penaeus chinensis]
MTGGLRVVPTPPGKPLTKDMLEDVREALGTSRLEPTGEIGRGYISEGEVYATDTDKVFIKRNSDKESRNMFKGEFESLRALANSGVIKAPTPHAVVSGPGGESAIVMDYVEMRPLNHMSREFGERLARLHLHNTNDLKWDLQEGYVGSHERRVTRFGFPVNTYCGYMSLLNDWCDDWEVFYARQLDNQFRKITRVFGNREASELWSELQLKIPSFFANVKIKPSLLHGDLYYGNTAETINGPVMFDPGSLYGHHEFDCVISTTFGSFSSEVWEEYYTRVPRAPGWHPRQKLYKLFHLANQWNHFGSERASVCLREMKELCHLEESRSEPAPAGIVQPVPPPSSS